VSGAGGDHCHQEAEYDGPSCDPIRIGAQAIRGCATRAIAADDRIRNAGPGCLDRGVELPGRGARDRLTADLDGPARILSSALGPTALQRLAQMLDFGPPSTTVEIDLRHAHSFSIPLLPAPTAGTQWNSEILPAGEGKCLDLSTECRSLRDRFP
jgi:hypothetical protein